jgi:hypothetical protein
MSTNYLKADPRVEHSLYMYSDFEGLDYLESYIIERKKSIRSMLIQPSIVSLDDVIGSILRYRREEPTTAIVQKLLSPSSITSVAGNINTIDILKKCLLCCLSNPTNQESIVDAWCGVFIRKIEVVKVLYGTYNKQLKPTEYSKESGIVAYALLSLILALRQQHTRHLRYLNTLLKVNDILTYEIHNRTEFSNFEAEATRLSFELEEKAVRTLAHLKNVTLRKERCDAPS